MPVVPPPKSRLMIQRNGNSLLKQVPKPIILIDTREVTPFTFAAYKNWISGEQVQTLHTGDYSVLGMENLISLERKKLPELAATLMSERARFLRECERLAGFRHKAILIEATYEDVNSDDSYPYSSMHPNAISGALDAIEARWGISIIYTSRTRELAERKAASWLSKAFTYTWLEQNGFGRILQDTDNL